jgi:hypothetical protein
VESGITQQRHWQLGWQSSGDERFALIAGDSFVCLLGSVLPLIDGDSLIFTGQANTVQFEVSRDPGNITSSRAAKELSRKTAAALIARGKGRRR